MARSPSTGRIPDIAGKSSQFFVYARDIGYARSVRE